MAPLIGHKQKMKLLTITNELLNETATASMTLDSQPVEPAHLRTTISAGAGTVTYSGTDENDVVISEVLTFSGLLEYLTGYLFKTVTAVDTALSGSPNISIAAENDSGEPINAESEGSPIACTFYEMPNNSRIYHSLGLYDKVIYYVRLSKRHESIINNTTKFKIVGRGDTVFEAATAISKVISPNSNMYSELQFYATEVRTDG